MFPCHVGIEYSSSDGDNYTEDHSSYNTVFQFLIEQNLGDPEHVESSRKKRDYDYCKKGTAVKDPCGISKDLSVMGLNIL